MVLGHIHIPEEQLAPGVAHSELAEQPASFKVISRKKTLYKHIYLGMYYCTYTKLPLRNDHLAYPAAGLNVSYLV